MLENRVAGDREADVKWTTGGSASHLFSDRDLCQLAQEVGRTACAAGWRIVTAGSCTAGWIAKALTDVAGSSHRVDSGFVTHSNTARMRDLGVLARTLDEHGVVSEATVREMASGPHYRPSSLRG